ESARRRGVAAALLEHLVQAARAQGMTRLSLETGSWPYFAAARAFYARHGFAPCGPFGDYAPDPNSVFMTRLLTDPTTTPTTPTTTPTRAASPERTASPDRSL